MKMAGRSGLDIVDTTLLKGVGIFLIVVHNFLHLVRPLPGENEFDFKPERIQSFLDGVVMSPEAIPRLVASFLGHYGVQLFVFLSAYGLTKSFQRKIPSYGSFLRARFDRIYFTFLIALGAWAVREGAEYGLLGPLKIVYWNWKAVVLKVTLVSNLVPGQALTLVGPWWFLPFIFQFYLLFPALLRFGERWGDRALALFAGAGVILAFLLNEYGQTGILILATPLGHMPELCLGIWCARRAEIQIPPSVAIVAALGLALGNMEPHAWYLSHFAALVLMLFAWSRVGDVVRQSRWLNGFFLFLGGLSMQLFLVNGFLRNPFLKWARSGDSEFLALGFGVLSFLLSILVALGVRWVEACGRRILAPRS